MVKLIKYGFVFIGFILTISVHAQVYPVSGNAVLVPPYSVYLADYTSPTSDRLISNIVLNDASRPELRVRLRIKITGQNISLETKPEYIGREIVLEGGVPLRLTGIDLAEYFNPNNLNFSGITRRTFEQTGALPQGFYQFCIEVLEYNRGVKISNTICAPGWLILNDPPIINLPRNGEKLKPLQPQNVVFQWTPRHTGSPNSAFTTEYDIKLVEIWPANRNPNDAILTSPPILEATTRSTTFIYDVSQTPLELGRNYALQVKAKSLAGVDELDLFKNNGRSEVITFTYGDPCDIPGNITAEATSATRFTVNWLGTSNHTGYRVEYRQASNAAAPWYSTNALTTDVGVSALKPDTKYEYRVAGTCGVFESVFSSVGVITTKTSGETGYACGLPLEPFNLDPSQLINVLKVGDVIDAGDFEVVLAKVSGSGTFSGEGVIEMPFFNKARVKAEFTSIQVNKDMRMVSGHMNVTGAAVEVIPAGVMDFMDNLSEVLTGLDTMLTNMENNLPKPFDEHAFVPDTTLTLAGPVIITKAPDGSVVITDNTGKTHTLPPGTEAAVIDDKGNATLVDNTGKTHSVPIAVAQAAANREYNLKLTFAEALTQTYGFDDAYRYPELKGRYDKLEGEYYIPYKSIEAGKTDNLTAVLGEGSIDKSKIRFEAGGVPITATPFSGNQTTLMSRAQSNGEQEALIAIYSPADTAKKDQVLGRVNVVSYNAINNRLVIVPVNGTEYKLGTAATLQTALNKIYGQAVVNWSVEVKASITVDNISPFNVVESGLLSNYTNHMKDVIKVYKDNMENDDNTYYLFLVTNPSDPKVAGVMPRSKNAGFIFYDKHGSEADIARTMAHELGHGAFNLHHTFMEENFKVTESTTDNLMDYTGGTKLYKYQWDMMRYPPIVMGVFESDEEGAYFDPLIHQQILKEAFNALPVYPSKEVEYPMLWSVGILTDASSLSCDAIKYFKEPINWDAVWSQLLTVPEKVWEGMKRNLNEGWGFITDEQIRKQIIEREIEEFKNDVIKAAETIEKGMEYADLRSETKAEFLGVEVNTIYQQPITLNNYEFIKPNPVHREWYERLLPFTNGEIYCTVIDRTTNERYIMKSEGDYKDFLQKMDDFTQERGVFNPVEFKNKYLKVQSQTTPTGDFFYIESFAMQEYPGIQIKVLKRPPQTSSQVVTSATNNTEIGVGELKIKVKIDGRYFEILMKCDGIATDVHFDNKPNTQAILGEWNLINSRMASLGSLSNANALNYGIILHHIQDFYSHSNYVEQYLGYIANVEKKDLQAFSVTSIPTFDVAQSNAAFMQSDYGKALKTGEFSIESHMINQMSGTVSSDNHDAMNKDNPTSPQGEKLICENCLVTYYQAAFDVAKRHTIKVLSK